MGAEPWYIPFRRAMAAFVQPIADELKTRSVPLRYIFLYSFNEDGNAHGTGRYVFDPSGLTYWITGGAGSRSGAVLEVARRHSEIARVLITDAAGHQASSEMQVNLLNFALAAFVRDYVDQGTDRPATWDSRRFNRLYRRLAESIATQSSHITVWAPILQLAGGADARPISVGLNCQLIEPNTEWQVRLAPTFQQDAPPPYIGPPPRLFLRHEEIASYKQPSMLVGHAIVNDALLAIRLAVGGYAQIQEQRTFARQGEARPLGSRAGIGMGLPTRQVRVGERSQVTRRDLPHIRRLSRSMESLAKSFPLAVDRFRMTAERTRHQDRLIDAVVGLESVLLQGIRLELRFQFSLRGAWLLGGTSHERLQWMDKLKRVYSARSEVVHGDARGHMKLDDATVAISVDALRQILARIALNGWDPKQLQAALDTVPFGK